MFDIAPTEFLLVAVVALVVIGPKDLPRVMRVVGQWVGKARGMARHFRSGIDTMMREAELEEMGKEVEGGERAHHGRKSADVCRAACCASRTRNSDRGAPREHRRYRPTRASPLARD